MLKNQVPYITTNQGVVFVIDDVPHSINATNIAYNRILEILTGSDVKDTDQLMHLAYPVKKLQTLFQTDAGSTIYMDVDDFIKAKLDGYEVVLPDSLANEIIRIADAGESLAPLHAFIVKLYNNPIQNVRNQLYRFIQSGGLALTTGGNFLAYKNVSTEFMDLRTGKFDNSPGKLVTMPRHQVQQDESVTCASGLHVCNWEYLKHYYSSGSKTVIVSVNPADVVSVPNDYNNSKMRCCAYSVLREVEQPEELKQRIIWEEAAEDHYSDEEHWEEDDAYDTWD